MILKDNRYFLVKFVFALFLIQGLVLIKSFGTEEYNRIDADYNSGKTGLKKTPCEQLDDLRITLVKLSQTRESYFPRPCFRGWPCLFTQHRSEISKICEQLDPVRRRLERECELHMIQANIERTISSSSHNQNTNQNILHSDVKFNFTVPNVPKP